MKFLETIGMFVGVASVMAFASAALAQPGVRVAQAGLDG